MLVGTSPPPSFRLGRNSTSPSAVAALPWGERHVTSDDCHGAAARGNSKNHRNHTSTASNETLPRAVKAHGGGRDASGASGEGGVPGMFDSLEVKVLCPAGGGEGLAIRKGKSQAS